MNTGIVILSTGSNHSVEFEGNTYFCKIKGKLRLKDFRSTNPVAVGDIVDFEIADDTSGIIVKIHDRKNCILRKSTNLSKDTQVLAANIDQAIFVYTMRNPETTTVFLDRFLVSAESYSIPTVIVFNKSDIYAKSEFDDLAEIMATYDEIGYKIILCSIEKSKNLEAIEEVLKDKTSVISGHSGVGKTSIINAMIPNFNLKTSLLSESHQSGKHTTTFAQMLKLPFGGYIIDTPGIRGFGLVNLKKQEIYHYFPEFFKASHQCKYQNCTHINEPECAVKNAIELGEISYSRYKSYLNIFLDEDDKHRIKEV